MTASALGVARLLAPIDEITPSSRVMSTGPNGGRALP
jgi:hypothetical protein